MLLLPPNCAQDKGLLKAIDAADRIVEKMKQDANNLKWDIVARKLREGMPGTLFSKNACLNRFKTLRDMTARIPPEFDVQNDLQGEGDEEDLMEDDGDETVRE